MNYYSNLFPTIDDYVYVSLQTITDERGIYVTLTEYANIEGFILPNEIPKKVNMNKLFGKPNVICQVVHANADAKTIDLSYKLVSNELREKLEKKYTAITKIIHFTNIFTKWKTTDVDVENIKLRQSILDDTTIQDTNYDDLYLNLLKHPKNLFKNINIEEHVDNAYVLYISSKIKMIDAIVTCDLNLYVTNEDPLHIIKDILLSDDSYASENVCIEHVESPRYKIVATHTSKEMCYKLISDVKELIKQKCLTHNIAHGNAHLAFNDPVVVRDEKIFLIS